MPSPSPQLLGRRAKKHPQTGPGRGVWGQVETPEVTQPRGWCEPKRVGTLQSHGGGLKHRQRTPEPVPEAEGVRIETDPGAWSLQVQAKPEAESQQEVPTCSGG